MIQSELELQRQSFKPTIFFYELADRKAMKIAVLIKFSELPYLLEQIPQQQAFPFVLKTPTGELNKQYEIINYILMEDKLQKSRIIQEERFSKSKSEQEDDKAQEECRGRKEPLVGLDPCIQAKMSQLFFNFRNHLFPLLDEFYLFMYGHKKARKSKYHSMLNRVRNEIARLDATMNDNSEVFSDDSNYINILIACELFTGFKFVFEEKIRKSKRTLFNKYEYISRRPQFQAIYGKTTLCLKQYTPPQFEEEELKRQEDISPKQEIIKVTEPVFLAVDKSRNQLLYSYFKSVLIQSQSKVSYFPYFWLMYPKLNCTLVEISYVPPNQSQQLMSQSINMLHFELQKYLKPNVDYGLIGLYEIEKQYLLRGSLILGSKGFEELESGLHTSTELKEYSLRAIDPNNPKERKDIEILWQHATEHTTYQQLHICRVVYL